MAPKTRKPPSRQTRRVAILGGNRIPFARAQGAYARASNQDMLTATLDGLVARYGLAGERLGEVVAGGAMAAHPARSPAPCPRARPFAMRPAVAAVMAIR